MEVKQADIEKILDGLHGPRENFRKVLLDKDNLLACMCDYAEWKARKKKVEPWSIISEMTGHGSGVSNAIYRLYRRRRDDG